MGKSEEDVVMKIYPDGKFVYVPLKILLETHDEEAQYAERIGEDITLWLESLDLDTINNQYIIEARVTKTTPEKPLIKKGKK